MKIKISQTYDFGLNINTKYCILNQHVKSYYTQIHSKVLIRTMDLQDLLNISPHHITNLKPTPYLNLLTHCRVKFKRNCKLIQLRSNLKLEGNTKPMKTRTKKVLHTSHKYVTFTPIEQANLGYQPLRTFLVPQDKIDETHKDIKRDLFLYNV